MITITIETDNAAFEGRHRPREIARILQELAVEYRSLYRPNLDGLKLRDSNGNTVGVVQDDGA